MRGRAARATAMLLSVLALGASATVVATSAGPARTAAVAAPAEPGVAAGQEGHGYGSCRGRPATMNIVAHQDDDILFINPDLRRDIKAKRCVVTVFVTAGDAGRTKKYWKGREAGARAAYATMAGVPSRWTSKKITTGTGQQVLRRTLRGTRVMLIFLRLPGGTDGYAKHLRQTIGKLRDGRLPKIRAIDGSAVWTKIQLRDALTAMMTAYRPAAIRTLDYTRHWHEGDHADHHNAAVYAYEAHRRYEAEHTFTGYRGYPMSKLGKTLRPGKAATKLDVFLAYARYDDNVCQTREACRKNHYWPWLSRSYKVTGPVDHSGK